MDRHKQELYELKMLLLFDTFHESVWFGLVWIKNMPSSLLCCSFVFDQKIQIIRENIICSFCCETCEKFKFKYWAHIESRVNTNDTILTV